MLVNLFFLMSSTCSFIRPFLICFSDASSRSLNGPSIDAILLSLTISTCTLLMFLLDRISCSPMSPNLHARRLRNFKSLRYELYANCATCSSPLRHPERSSLYSSGRPVAFLALTIYMLPQCFIPLFSDTARLARNSHFSFMTLMMT